MKCGWAAAVLAPALLAAAAAPAVSPPAVSPDAMSPDSRFDPSTVRLDELPGLATDDLAASLRVFRASCATVLGRARAAGSARPLPPGLAPACRVAAAMPVSAAGARRFFADNFVVRRVRLPAFFTGYYEPEVQASLQPTADYPVPLLAVPPGFVAGAGHAPATWVGADGASRPVPDRAGIETGALGAGSVPLAYVRDRVDAFFIQVQGSARLVLPDGSRRRLAFAARNGYPYTAIGKVLVDQLHIPPAQMGMAELKAWLRTHGQGAADAGTALMRQNRSFIFFRFDDRLRPDAGPVGAAGVSLTAGRSLAVDRAVWPYGLPMYVVAEGTVPLRRMTVAQDTGTAIVGPARADIFFGSGAEAAARAGPMRDPGTLFVLWPKHASGGAGAR